jgi:hypothetical protein
VIVVSNTSPLTSLAAIGQFHLLQALYGQIHIAAAVWDELNAGGMSWPGRDEVARSEWIRRHALEDSALLRALETDLDRGEVETLALAAELRADLVLLDEREVRTVARRMGLRFIGVLGVLLEAKARGFVEAVRPQLDALRGRAGFYLDDQLFRDVMELAGEAG